MANSSSFGFINNYFLQPIHIEQNYTYVNTIVYAIIAFGILYLLGYGFKKAKIKLDTHFLVSTFPFIAIGSFLRVLVDKREVARSFWTVSPGIYISVAGLFISATIIGYAIKRRWNLSIWKSVFILGLSILIAILLNTLPLRTHNILSASLIFLVFLSFAWGLYVIMDILNWVWATKSLQYFAFVFQLFDSVYTSFLTELFGAVEKHPLPRAVIEYTNSGFSFLPLKIFVVLTALYFITNDVKDKHFRNILIIAIAILGAAQGLRNVLGFIIF